MGLRENILHEPVSELNLRELPSIGPMTTAREAVAIMREKKIGCVIVLDDEGKPLGKFTEKRLIRLLLVEPQGMATPVFRHLAGVGECVKLTDPIVRVLDLIQTFRLRYVCVVDRNGKAVALTGQRGVMEYIAEHFPRLIKSQMLESKLFMDRREGA